MPVRALGHFTLDFRECLSMAGKPKVYYFNGRGRMETIWWPLATAGVEVRCWSYLIYFHVMDRKMWYIYTMEYYSAIRKNEILPFAAMWMDLEGIMLSEISQTEKNKYCMISLNVESKKYNKPVSITKKEQTHRYREKLVDF